MEPGRWQGEKAPPSGGPQPLVEESSMGQASSQQMMNENVPQEASVNNESLNLRTALRPLPNGNSSSSSSISSQDRTWQNERGLPNNNNPAATTMGLLELTVANTGDGTVELGDGTEEDGSPTTEFLEF
jgi:hypothetical protein